MKKGLFLMLALALLTACSSVMITGRKQLLLVSDADVIASSATAYKQLIDSLPGSKDTINVGLVRKVGKNIASAVETYMTTHGMAADVPQLKWEFNVIKDSLVNAFCMPGGKVVFYEGILPVAQTEAGIAVVMGHEVAHAVAKHSNERMSQQMLAQYGASLTDVLLSNKTVATRQTINTIYGIGAQVGVILPYSRKHELEADRLGLIFMAMAGYDPNEAVVFWQRMAAASGGAPLEILSTHPSDQQRIEKLKAALPEAMTFYKKQ